VTAIGAGAAYLTLGVTGNDCDGNGVPDACDIADGIAADCDGNGVPDACDIASGIAADCDGNGVPDACDIAYGIASDCNGNGVPDACDIAYGIAADCNGNGVPDACDGGCPAPLPAPPRCLGDLDGNDRVGVEDLIAVIIAWGVCHADDTADLTDDGFVDVHDLLVVLRHWGACPDDATVSTAPRRRGLLKTSKRETRSKHRQGHQRRR
jgi:hypothetical protein